MTLNIAQFRAQLTNGGARNTLFRVEINNPMGMAAAIKTPFLVRAASLPSLNRGVIRVGYMGRTLKYAGDTEFEPWSVTVINDEDFLLRNELERWHGAIQRPVENVRDFSSTNPLLYKSTATVTQLNAKREELRTYKFEGLFPAQIDSIPLDWQAQNQIEEFQVQFEYDWWEVSGKTGDGPGR